MLSHRPINPSTHRPINPSTHHPITVLLLHHLKKHFDIPITTTVSPHIDCLESLLAFSEIFMKTLKVTSMLAFSLAATSRCLAFFSSSSCLPIHIPLSFKRAPTSIYTSSYLLATSLPSSQPPSRRGSSPSNRSRSTGKFSGVGNRNKHRNKGREREVSREENGKEILAPPPPITLPGGPLPSYFTCRHTYEDVLMEEIRRSTDSLEEAVITSSPSPGLVRVETSSSDNGSSNGELEALLSSLDCTYALQSLPNCVVVTAPSIKQLAIKALEALSIDGSSEKSEALRAAPRGSLAVHALVPGMFKGQRDPVLKRRADKVAEEAAAIMKKSYKCARKKSSEKEEDYSLEVFEGNKWVLQMLVLAPEIVVASLSTATNIRFSGFTWPNWGFPAGLANVDIVEAMPSSAYRKLLEAVECMRVLPPKASNPWDGVPPVVDLGACPGGWTAALRMMGSKVISVDRSKLTEDLMADEMVEFIKGDAFTYEPPWAKDHESRGTAPAGTWMVSDVIAYPERVAELLDRWCGNHWVGHAVVTVKFQGDEVPWDALDAATIVASGHGYKCRMKHFFNNKNEVTLMVVEETALGREDAEAFLGKPMYPGILPASS